VADKNRGADFVRATAQALQNGDCIIEILRLANDIVIERDECIGREDNVAGNGSGHGETFARGVAEREFAQCQCITGDFSDVRDANTESIPKLFEQSATARRR
jgi:hypothetical protein